MKSIKTLLFGSTIAFGLLFGTSVFADSLYTVKAGDTLSEISHQFYGNNDFINNIAKDNKIKNINLIFPGQELTIKTDGVTPIVNNTPVVEEAVTYEEPQQVTYAAPANTSTPANSSSAKEWIAQKESGGDYNATNGYHIGRYQLDPNYLNGDYSPENQEKVADQYVADRYGSWEGAMSFWQANGWY